MTPFLVIVFPVAMIIATGTDLASMTISNRLVAGFGFVFFAFALSAGLPLSLIGVHVATAAVVLLLTFACFAFGWMGGGDAKLIAAVALWLGPTADLAQFALLSSLFGGALTLALLLCRALASPTTGIASVDRLLRPETGVPYGVALGAAGLTVFVQGNLGAPVLALMLALG